MSDIAILKEMIRDCAIVELEYKKEYKRDSYLLKLTENQDNYSFVISGMPEPDRVIVIKLDEFFDVRTIFTGDKGECKRADFIIIANTTSEKVILCLEMKKSRDSNSSITKQLKGAECFVSYLGINPIFFRTINIALLVLKISVFLKQPPAAVNPLKKMRFTINQKKC
jgi:hypothetical protein